MNRIVRFLPHRLLNRGQKICESAPKNVIYFIDLHMTIMWQNAQVWMEAVHLPTKNMERSEISRVSPYYKPRFTCMQPCVPRVRRHGSPFIWMCLLACIFSRKRSMHRFQRLNLLGCKMGCCTSWKQRDKVPATFPKTQQSNHMAKWASQYGTPCCSFQCMGCHLDYLYPPGIS